MGLFSKKQFTVIMVSNNSERSNYIFNFLNENCIKINTEKEFTLDTIKYSSNIVEDVLNNINPDFVLIDTDIGEDKYIPIIEKLKETIVSKYVGVMIISSSLENDSSEHVIKALNAGSDYFIESNCLESEFLSKFNVLVKIQNIIDGFRSINKTLKKLSDLDSLTGMFNMRAFWSMYAKTISTCKKENKSFAMYMIDLDNFKGINDNYNHIIGSKVLAEVGSRILNDPNLLLQNDYAVRYGGDEFIVIKQVSSLDETHLIGGRISSLLSDKDYLADNEVIKLSVSMGSVFVEEGFYCADEDPLKIADLLLYQAKNSGKRCFKILGISKDTEVDKIIKELSASQEVKRKEKVKAC